jgi:CubicO group peptidase (beta-lactamase class C family)
MARRIIRLCVSKKFIINLYKYLPYPDIEYDDRYKLITARYALSHQTGFPNWRYDEPDKKLDIMFKPGTGFHYSGEGYQYLAKVIAHLNNIEEGKLDSIFQKEIAEPLSTILGQYSEINNKMI